MSRSSLGQGTPFQEGQNTVIILKGQFDSSGDVQNSKNLGTQTTILSGTWRTAGRRS